jgi:hypothetical protein
MPNVPLLRTLSAASPLFPWTVQSLQRQPLLALVGRVFRSVALRPASAAVAGCPAESGWTQYYNKTIITHIWSE